MADPLQRPDSETRNHNISESFDKIQVKAKLVRGSDTRDQDKLDIRVKGDDPEAVVERLNATLDLLAETADDVRAIQPGAEADE